MGERMTKYSLGLRSIVSTINFKNLVAISLIICPLLLEGCGDVHMVNPTPSASIAVEKKSIIKAEELVLASNSAVTPNKDINLFCDKLDKKFYGLGWKKAPCRKTQWKTVRTSVKGTPLIWKTYGEWEEDNSPDTTLIFCGVHGDEITPVKFCFDIMAHLDNIKAGKVTDPMTNRPADFKGKFIVVAPVVNPDSFFKKYPTRTNANGVDINRNFPTKDFKQHALKVWRTRYRKDKRRYPGVKAMSEPEVLFQVNLMKRYKPSKIISVHAPLTMLDYDGPAGQNTGGKVGNSANQLLIQMAEQAKNYRIKNYPFFPGSLGNYAGNERNIPTYTLELPTSDNRNSRRYWRQFKNSIYSAIMHEMTKERDVAFDGNDKTTQNSN
jgi:murein peptide amidase A